MRVAGRSCDASLRLDWVQPLEEQAGGLPTRDLGGLIGETFNVYRASFWPFVIIVFSTQLPFVLARFTPGGISVLLFLIGFMVSILATATTAYAVAQQYLGQEIDIARCYGRAWGRAISLIGASVLVALALVGSLIMSVIVVGIPLLFYLALVWCSVIQAIVLEGESATAALGRSRALAKGSWWRVFGIGIVFWLIVIGLSIALVITLEIVGYLNDAAESIVSSAGAILLFPMFPIASTLLYIDLRVRKEGYNLGIMASEIGQ